MPGSHCLLEQFSDQLPFFADLISIIIIHSSGKSTRFTQCPATVRPFIRIQTPLRKHCTQHQFFSPIWSQMIKMSEFRVELRCSTGPTSICDRIILPPCIHAYKNIGWTDGWKRKRPKWIQGHQLIFHFDALPTVFAASAIVVGEKRLGRRHKELCAQFSFVRIAHTHKSKSIQVT